MDNKLDNTGRISMIKNRVNILSNEINKVKLDKININNNMTEIKTEIKDIQNYGNTINEIYNILKPKSNIKQDIKFSDNNGKLNNSKNPFIQASRNIQKNKRRFSRI